MSASEIHRVNHEIKRRKLQVKRVVDLTPRMRRITVGGPELAGFVSLGTDDHVKLMFATTPQERAALDDPDAHPDVRPTMREYTPRRIDLDAGELDLDFVLHGDGPASTWAAQAEPGQTLVIAGPRASMVVPDIFKSYLLVGDETAIPAIARRLEELPEGRDVMVVIEIEDDQERQVFESRARVDVIWVHRYQEQVINILDKLRLPDEPLYAWVALEKAQARAIKKLLLEEKGLNEQQVKAVAYWKADPDDED